MKILRGYTDAASSGSNNWGIPERAPAGETASRSRKEQKSSGDTISISAEAREMLENGGNSISVCPQDATYDQNGYVLRQVDSLRGDLRNLASHLMAFPEGATMAGNVRNMQQQLSSIQAHV